MPPPQKVIGGSHPPTHSAGQSNDGRASAAPCSPLRSLLLLGRGCPQITPGFVPLGRRQCSWVPRCVRTPAGLGLHPFYRGWCLYVAVLTRAARGVADPCCHGTFEPCPFSGIPVGRAVRRAIWLRGLRRGRPRQAVAQCGGGWPAAPPRGVGGRVGSSLPFFYSLLLFVRFAFRFIVIIIITIFGARCAVVCLPWCEEFYRIALAWICDLTVCTGLG